MNSVFDYLNNIGDKLILVIKQGGERAELSDSKLRRVLHVLAKYTNTEVTSIRRQALASGALKRLLLAVSMCCCLVATAHAAPAPIIKD